MTDVFPPRNLPPEAEEWGREVETRIYLAENSSLSSGQSISGLNRNTSTTLQDLASQVQELEVQVGRVQSLYDALPIAYQRTSTFTGFGLASSSWNDIGSITFVPPSSGVFVVSTTASGQLVSNSTSTNMECDFRLSIGTDQSFSVPGLYATPDGVWVNNFMITWGWSVSVTPETPLVITLQADPVTSASWGSGTGSYAVLSGFATFVKS